MAFQQSGDLCTKGNIVEDQATDKSFAVFVDHHVAFVGSPFVRQNIRQNTDFAAHSFDVFLRYVGPHGRPIWDAAVAHEWMISEFHKPSYYRAMSYGTTDCARLSNCVPGQTNLAIHIPISSMI